MDYDNAEKAARRLSKFSNARPEILRKESLVFPVLDEASGPDGNGRFSSLAEDLMPQTQRGFDTAEEFPANSTVNTGQKANGSQPCEAATHHFAPDQFERGPQTLPEDEDLPTPAYNSRLLDELERVRVETAFDDAPSLQDAAYEELDWTPPLEEPITQPQAAGPEAGRAALAQDVPSAAPAPEKKTAMRRIKAVAAAQKAAQACRAAGTGRRIKAGVQGAISLTSKSGKAIAGKAGRAWNAAPNTRTLIKAARTKTFSARYRMAMAAIHSKLVDRELERLLFVQSRRGSTTPGIQNASQAPAAEVKNFHYDGPAPRLVLQWVLDTLPEDLKTFAFVDFRAENGRTMLLAARRNFETIYGYAFDAQTHDDIEMNIAQYPRSRMVCRNLRAIRGDVEGVSIPNQPAVLFFPKSERDRYLGIIMNHVAASFRLNPRPLYLIFDNAPQKMSLEHEDIFEQAAISLPLKLKLFLLSPARMKIYRSVLIREG